MANVRKLSIKYNDKTDEVFARRLRHSSTMRLFGMLRGGMGEDGKLDVQHISAGNIANFQINLIAESICDESGRVLFTPDQVDEWGEEEDGAAKINAYVLAINPSKEKEVVAGN